jgi:hypothetical protein
MATLKASIWNPSSFAYTVNRLKLVQTKINSKFRSWQPIFYMGATRKLQFLATKFILKLKFIIKWEK